MKVHNFDKELNKTLQRCGLDAWRLAMLITGDEGIADHVSSKTQQGIQGLFDEVLAKVQERDLH